MHKEMDQLTLADGLFMLNPKLGKNETLEAINTVFDWSPINQVLSAELHTSTTGAPAYPPLKMFKSLLLAQWYTLSDPRLEDALNDSLSFRRFAGYSLTAKTPDHSTLARFRQDLEANGLGERLFHLINEQLEEKGLVIKQGSLLDATIVEAQVRKPVYKEGESKLSNVDPEARWTKKGGRSYFGYKLHVGVDEGSGIVRQAVVTPANVNDTSVADVLISGDEQAVYADKAYEDKKRRKRLKQLGIKDRLMHRSHKNQAKLPHWQSCCNKLISKIRCNVERVFGSLKRHYGYVRVRYVGLAANANHAFILLSAYNLKRYATLVG